MAYTVFIPRVRQWRPKGSVPIAGQSVVAFAVVHSRFLPLFAALCSGMTFPPPSKTEPKDDSMPSLLSSLEKMPSLTQLNAFRIVYPSPPLRHFACRWQRRWQTHVHVDKGVEIASLTHHSLDQCLRRVLYRVGEPRLCAFVHR